MFSSMFMQKVTNLKKLSSVLQNYQPPALDISSDEPVFKSQLLYAMQRRKRLQLQ